MTSKYKFWHGSWGSSTPSSSRLAPHEFPCRCRFQFSGVSRSLGPDVRFGILGVNEGGFPCLVGVGGAGHLGLTHTGNAARQVVDGLRTEVCGQQKQSNDPRNNQHSPSTPTTGRR